MYFTFDVKKLLLGQWLSIDGIIASLLDKLHYQSLLKHVVGYCRQHWLLRNLITDWKIELEFNVHVKGRII